MVDIYNKIFRSDGRIYKGLWLNGMQHGFAEVFNPEKKIWEKTIWENGLLVKLLDEEEKIIDLVN